MKIEPTIETDSDIFKAYSDDVKKLYTASEDGKTQTFTGFEIPKSNDDEVKKVVGSMENAKRERNDALAEVHKFKSLGMSFDELSALVDENHRAKRSGTKKDDGEKPEATPGEASIEDLPLSVQREINELKADRERLQKEDEKHKALQNDTVILKSVRDAVKEHGLNPAAEDDIFRFVKSKDVKVEVDKVFTEDGKTLSEIVASEVEKSTHWKGVNKGGGFEGNANKGGESKLSPWSLKGWSVTGQTKRMETLTDQEADAEAQAEGLKDRFDTHPQLLRPVSNRRY